MIKKISLLINTLRYLKFPQLFFQILNRLKKKECVFYLGQDVDNVLSLQFLGKPCVKSKYQIKNSFNFLNQEKKFEKQVDWNFLSYGKLWNYNLEYFD